MEALHGEFAELAGSLAAGESTTRWLVYDLPADARDVRFAIHWGGAVVNALEALVFGAKDIAPGSGTSCGPSADRLAPH